MTRLSVEPIVAPPASTVTPLRPATTSAEVPIPEPQAVVQPRLAVAAPPQPSQTDMALAVATAAFTGLGYALSARAILLAVLVGGFVLGVLVMQNPSVVRLLAMVAYGALAVLPCVWLERMKGR